MIKICISIVSENMTQLKNDLPLILQQPFDCIEWRMDCVNDFAEIEPMAALIHSSFQCPCILTLRSRQEGGYGDTLDYERYYAPFIQRGWVSYIDIELNCDCMNMIAYAKKHHVKVIGSYHCLKNAVSDSVIRGLYNSALDKQCDVFKIASFPNDIQEVCEQLLCTYDLSLRNEMEIISICMGEKGKISRVVAGLFGSMFTFASSNKKSAPGQIEAIKMKQYLELFD